MTELINRPEYLEQLVQNEVVGLVKIVTGIRRCGKSSLPDLFHQYLLDNGVDDANIIHMNLESLRYRNLSDYLAFYDYVSERIPKTGRTYLIFDELQASTLLSGRYVEIHMLPLSFKEFLTFYEFDASVTVEEKFQRIRRGYRVYIGKVGETEVDFVAEKPNDKLYIQVTESMQSPETRKRELRPLRMISDNYEKIVLSMDRAISIPMMELSLCT